MTDVKRADRRQLLEICAMRKARVLTHPWWWKKAREDGFYHHLPYISTGLFRFCCRFEKNGYRQIVSCVAHFSIWSDIGWPRDWEMSIADRSSSSSWIDPILHFCHFWALGFGPWRLLSPNQFALPSSARYYDPGEIIILMVFARTNE